MDFHYLQITFDLIKEIAWPVVFLISILVIKNPLIKAFKSLFENKNIKHFSFGKDGISAELEQKANKVDESLSENITYNIKNLSNPNEYERIVSLQEEKTNEYSLLKEKEIEEHLKTMNIDKEKENKLLIKELSLLGLLNEFIFINRVLFKSQYLMLSEKLYKEQLLSFEDSHKYYTDLKKIHPKEFSNWMIEDYLEYLLNVNLIEIKDNSYKLTKKGQAYVEYMKRNANEVNHLAKL